MRWLIDGYNVMHAAGRLGPKLGREGFRRAAGGSLMSWPTSCRSNVPAT